MRRRACLAVWLAVAIQGAPGLAQAAAPPANPLIDYPGFQALVRDVAALRQARLIGWDRFAAEARDKGAILLDARSAADFRRGHIRGAVNLPFPEFTDERLTEVLGPDRERPIYVYCNNNFSDNAAPVVTKRVQLALNIPTFVNLVGYGYANVWELGEVISMKDPRIGWVSGDDPPV